MSILETIWSYICSFFDLLLGFSFRPRRSRLEIILDYICSFFNWLFGLSSQSQSQQKIRLETVNLKNGLEVLLVQNEVFKTSVIGLQIQVGHIQNPAEAPGLVSLLKNLVVQGSSKYSEKDYLNTFTGKHGGYFVGTVHNNITEFTVKINDLELANAADILAWSIANPLIKKEKIDDEIHILDQSFKNKKETVDFVFEDLYSSVIDDSFPEHRFFNGNRESLSISGIEEKLKELHSNYYTVDKIKLVICSKKPLSELKGIANIFKILPKKNDKILKKNSDMILSCYSKKLAGSIIKYHSNCPDNTMNIVIKCPFLKQTYSHKPFEYLKQFIFREHEKSLTSSLKGFVKKIGFKYEFINANISYALLEFILTPVGVARIDDVIQIVHTTMTSQTSFRGLHNQVKFAQENRKRKEEKYELLASSFFLEQLNDFSQENIMEYDTICKYEFNNIKDLFDIIGNIENWIVLVSTPETGLSNKIKYSETTYDNPILIESILRHSNDEGQMKNSQELENEFFIPTSTTKLYRIQAISHREFENGEYTALSNASWQDVCMVKLKLFTNAKQEEMLSNWIFWNSFVDYIYKNFSESLKCKCTFNCFDFFPVETIIFNGSKNEILETVKVIFDEIKKFKPSSLAIHKSKSMLRKILLENKEDAPTFDNLIDKLKKLLKNYPIDLYDINDNIQQAEYNKYPEWYTSIEAHGDISNFELNIIYNAVKSTGGKELFKASQILKNRNTFKSSDSLNNGIMLAYKISYIPDDQYNALFWQYVTGTVICILFTYKFSNYLKSKLSKVETSFMFTEILDEQVFITLSVQSPDDIKTIEKALLDFTNTVDALIRNFTNEDLEFPRNCVGELMSLDVELDKDASNSLTRMSEFRIFNTNFKKKFKNIIDSITREDLLRAKVFGSEPIVINSIPIESNTKIE